MKNKGFTLIELLVVIAIIGILASVVLASLNTARAKGADSAIKANINNARAQAELFYSENSTYVGVCLAGTNTILPMLNGANSAGGTATCTSSSTAWAAQSVLKASSNIYCVDSLGAATTTASSNIADGVCG